MSAAINMKLPSTT